MDTTSEIILLQNEVTLSKGDFLDRICLEVFFMRPAVDKKKTGLKLKILMDERRITVKDVQQYLGLGSVQSVYHWLNGIALPATENLFALSILFRVPIDELLCGEGSVA